MRATDDGGDNKTVEGNASLTDLEKNCKKNRKTTPYGARKYGRVKVRE